MNTYFLTAGILCFVLGLAHSLLGEFLIFNHKRKPGKFVPTKVEGGLRERHLRIIWATWHMASFFGWCIGLFLVKIAIEQQLADSLFIAQMVQAITYAMIASSLLVIIGTKGKHPGWIILLLIGILLFLGQ